MKLAKAIEIVTGIEADEDSEWEQDGSDALKLLIEAAKVIKAIRPYSNTNKSYYLPGETDD